MLRRVLIALAVGLPLVWTTGAYATIGSGTLVNFWSCDAADDTSPSVLGDVAGAQWCTSGGPAYDATRVGGSGMPARIAGPTGVADSAVQIYGNPGGGTIGYKTTQMDLGTVFTWEMMVRFDAYAYNWGYFTDRAGGPVTVSAYKNGGVLNANVGATGIPGNPWAGVGQWWLLAIVCDGTTANLYATPQGTAEQHVQSSAACTAQAVSATQGLSIGNCDSSRYGANGYVDWVAVWNVALTPEELSAQNVNNKPIPDAPVGPSWHPGDANKDGAVDLQDFGILKENFGIEIGTTGTWEMADFNGDKGIDLQDFGILKDHFGHTTGSVPVTAVPEPATMTLLALAGLGLIRRKR